MEFDEFIPGNILYTDRFSMKTTDGVSTQLVAGNPATGGFRDGKGLFARFRTIRGFTQISKTVVVLTDYDSSCLRQIDRERGRHLATVELAMTQDIRMVYQVNFSSPGLS